MKPLREQARYYAACKSSPECCEGDWIEGARAALEAVPRLCTCPRPAGLTPDGGTYAPGPHTKDCLITRIDALLEELNDEPA